MKRRFRRRWIVAIVSFVIVLSAGLYYLLDTYPAVSVEHSNNVSVTYEEKVLVMKPLDAEATRDAIVFYQGGKVDEKAYIELFAPLVEQGITVYIPSMPFELAVFGSKRAGEIIKSHNHERWFLGGHSLGGSMITNFMASSDQKINGLFLFASYSTEALSSYDGPVMSIYGNLDGVLNMKSFEKYKSNLPATTEYLIIEGGNHAQFGSYGFQKGDGIATIDQEVQQKFVQDNLLRMIQD